MTVKDDLHKLVDDLNELLEYAHWLVADEDELLGEDELVRLRAEAAAIAAGNYVTLEERRRETGV